MPLPSTPLPQVRAAALSERCKQLAMITATMANHAIRCRAAGCSECVSPPSRAQTLQAVRDLTSNPIMGCQIRPLCYGRLPDAREWLIHIIDAIGAAAGPDGTRLSCT